MKRDELRMELERILFEFRIGDSIPKSIGLGGGRTVSFDEEPCDDDSLGVVCLRNRQGVGLQIHELHGGRSIWEGVDEDYAQGGWLVQKDDTAEYLADEIMHDFEASMGSFPDDITEASTT